jgi:hypothetical protein
VDSAVRQARVALRDTYWTLNGPVNDPIHTYERHMNVYSELHLAGMVLAS